MAEEEEEYIDIEEKPREVEPLREMTDLERFEKNRPFRCCRICSFMCFKCCCLISVALFFGIWAASLALHANKHNNGWILNTKFCRYKDMRDVTTAIAILCFAGVVATFFQLGRDVVSLFEVFPRKGLSALSQCTNFILAMIFVAIPTGFVVCSWILYANYVYCQVYALDFLGWRQDLYEIFAPFTMVAFSASLPAILILVVIYISVGFFFLKWCLTTLYDQFLVD